MNISLNWLREFVDINETVEEVRDVLDDLGLVVEGVTMVGAGIADVVVAEVREIHPIEGADRIRRVVVETGNGLQQIVCGAMNFEVGNRVPLAPVGAVLPGDFVIASRKMKGVLSDGMLCSGKELGLGDDHNGLLILDEVTDATPGTPLAEALFIEPDVVFDISVEGNRPDAWSVEGVARDLAVRWNRPLRTPTLAEPTDSSDETKALVRGFIETPELCGRLVLSLLENVQIGPSPQWLSRRLEASGMRSISNVVDASNFVMLELGQPTHPYDFDRVGGGALGVRTARTGESLTTLDEVTRPLAQPGRGLGDTGPDVVIVDGDDTVLGLAGIMGGADSEITSSTTRVLLEAAYFDPMTIARASKRHGLRSEASNRFERGVDPELALRASARFVHLLKESCPDLVWRLNPLDIQGRLPERPEVLLEDGCALRTLGVDIEASEVTRILTGLNFSVTPEGPGLRVRPSSARLDVRAGAAGRADVLEEVARLYSYRRIPLRTPTWPTPGGLTAQQRTRRRLREFASALGVYEAWTASLISETYFRLASEEQPIRITNPLAAEESVLRPSLVPGLVDAWWGNVVRGTGNHLFGELGTVFETPTSERARKVRGGVGGESVLDLPIESEHFTVLFGRSADDAMSAARFAHVLGNRLRLENFHLVVDPSPPLGWHPTRTALVMAGPNSEPIGRCGEVDSELVAEIAGEPRTERLGLLELWTEPLAPLVDAGARATVPSRYPSATIDLAFVTPNEVSAHQLETHLRQASPLVESVKLFDVYRGENLGRDVRSLAFAIRLSATDHTLSDTEVSECREQLIEAVSTTGAKLR